MIDATSRGAHGGPQSWDNNGNFNNGFPYAFVLLFLRFHPTYDSPPLFSPPPPGPIYTPGPYGAPPPPPGMMSPPPMPMPPPLVPSTEVPEDELYLLPSTLPGYSLVIKVYMFGVIKFDRSLTLSHLCRNGVLCAYQRSSSFSTMIRRGTILFWMRIPR